jgi:hypothetical protein
MTNTELVTLTIRGPNRTAEFVETWLPSKP